MNYNNISGTQKGISGEYFVAAELSRRGYLCSITLKNTKGIDILVANENSSKLVGIQVKTTLKNKEWMMTKKAQDILDDNMVYVFVLLKELNELPDFYIVRSREVADYVRCNHVEWLNKPGKEGQKHNDTSMRKFRLFDEKYKNNWEIIDNLLR